MVRADYLLSAPGAQYLRVLLKRGLSMEHRIRTLAHELQHTREVVRAGIVPDAVQMNALFQRIGDKRLPDGSTKQYRPRRRCRLALLSPLTFVRAVRPGVAALSSGPIVGRFPAWDRALSDHEIVS